MALAEESGMSQYVATRNKYLQRFALLLIQECIGCCTVVEEDDEPSSAEGTFKDGALLCREEIKKHFEIPE